MICFSDYILSKSPWSYCRLNEPTGCFVYNDITGNKNHLFPQMSSGQFIQGATNQLASPYLGEVGIRCIAPLEANRTWGVNQIPPIPVTALRFNVLEFKSDSHIYRNRVRVQNLISPAPMWIDFQLNPSLEAISSPVSGSIPLAEISTGARGHLNRIVFDTDFDYTSAYDGGVFSLNELNTTTVLGRVYEPYLYFGSLVVVSETTVRIEADSSTAVRGEV